MKYLYQDNTIKLEYKKGFVYGTFFKKASVRDALLDTKIFSVNVVNFLLKNGLLKNITDGKILYHNRFVKSGEQISANIYDNELSNYDPIEKELEILYEDDFFLILNKPAGEILFFTASNNKPCIASYINHYYIKTNQKHKLRFVNRLDKDATGILIIAKNRLAHNFIFKNHSKKYSAIIPAIPFTSGIIDYPLIRNMPNTYCCPHGKESITIWRKAISNKQFSFVIVNLPTGRTHQIRVHFKHYFRPIIGDYQYDGMSSKIAQRCFLHCLRLRFKHPFLKQQIKITAPFPDDMKQFLIKIRDFETFRFYHLESAK
ncbi:MAG: pseudouridine synthase [Candidatus Muirbacterium halophilum]|nr:pseudouridine synthase [Candidatus Muirbacterium halophilum]MCK9476046.1 pseudouridine synthase [Candidatus Muirbacterium halophilum]